MDREPRDFHVFSSGAKREWVYFIGSESPENLIKIGKTRNVERRLTGLAMMSPVPVFLLEIFNAPARSEAMFHAVFSEYRAHGEWFKPGERLMRFLEGDYPEKLSLNHLNEICREFAPSGESFVYLANAGPYRDYPVPGT